MAEAGVALVPTLSGYYWMAGLGDAIDERAAIPAAEMPPGLVQLARHNIAEGAATMRAASSAGVKIALGSDVRLGTAVEYQRMIHHGLTPAQALGAATCTAADALGLGGQIGRVSAGMLADLVIVDGDPLAEPGLLTDPARIWLVLQLGVPVAGRALEGQLGSGSGPQAEG
jgi:imidazolonepropionase-like amidohydrolase